MSGFGLKEVPDKFRLKEYLDPEDIDTTTTTTSTTTTTTTYDWEVYDYDGNGYDTIIIGSQEWIVQNLRVETYSDGTPIPVITDEVQWAADSEGAMCYYDNDESTYKEIYGALYNHFAVVSPLGLPYFTREGVYEAGWRIPTEADWAALVAAYGGEAVAGGELKETGTTHWTPDNVGATNSSGLTVLPAGERSQFGTFSDINARAVFWEDREYDSDNAYFIQIEGGDAGVDINTYWQKIRGESVRCVRDLP